MSLSTTYPDHIRAARRITYALFAGQALGSAGFIATAAIAAIVGAELSGRDSLAGLPAAVFGVGSALAALLWGLLMDRLGRRSSLTFGLLLGVLGAAGAVWAVAVGSFWLLLVGLLVMGNAKAALQLSRFVAAEVTPLAQRGRAVATVVLGGTVGAVVGPLTVAPMGRLAELNGLPAVSGAYLATLLLFVLSAALIFALLRPNPRDLARAIEDDETRHRPKRPARPLGQILRDPAVITAMSAMVFGQAVMVMLMVMTSLHMVQHDHGLGGVSVVISAHTLGMYAFSLFSGQLTDRWGRVPVIVSGAVVLVLSALAAPLSTLLIPLSVSLFLLGLGWNFCFVGGSALLSDQLSLEERARTQGFNDLLIGLVSAAASFSSGLVFATLGYAAMGILGALISLVPLYLTLRWARTQRLATQPA
ncbi:MAG: MFS transporter [Trueperaceae bacterium]|nr:MFS transporter [Trueperaceae bacterium]